MSRGFFRNTFQKLAYDTVSLYLSSTLRAYTYLPYIMRVFGMFFGKKSRRRRGREEIAISNCAFLFYTLFSLIVLKISLESIFSIS